MASAYFVAHFSGGHQHFPASLPLCTGPLDPAGSLRVPPPEVLASSCPHETPSSSSLRPSPTQSFLHRDETLGPWVRDQELNLNSLA